MFSQKLCVLRNSIVADRVMVRPICFCLSTPFGQAESATRNYLIRFRMTQGTLVVACLRVDDWNRVMLSSHWGVQGWCHHECLLSLAEMRCELCGPAMQLDSILSPHSCPLCHVTGASSHPASHAVRSHSLLSEKWRGELKSHQSLPVWSLLKLKNLENEFVLCL